MQPQVAHGAGEIEVQDAGLDPGDPRDRVDVEHAVHLRRDDHDRIAERCRAAGQAGAAAARDERPSVPSRDAHRGRDLVGGARPAHRDRGTFGDTRVARVQRELERLGARSLRPDRGTQIIEERVMGVSMGHVAAVDRAYAERNSLRSCDCRSLLSAHD